MERFVRFSGSVLSLAVVSTVLLAGCQSSGDGVAADPPADPPADKESPAEQAADIEVVETGAATLRMFAFVRNNETRQVVVKIKFYPVDAAGKPVKAIGDSATVVLPPSSTIPVAMDVGRELPAKVTAELTPSTAKVKTTGPGDFTDKKATLSGGDGAPWRVKTSFTNGYAEAMESNIVVLICRDAADKVVGAVTAGYSAAPGETVTDEHDFTPPLDEMKGTPAKCEVFPRLSASYE
jgi:uncharacterized protein YcfL